MLCGQCLLCFYTLSLSEVTALVLLWFCFIQLGLNTSPGTMELGFSLTPLSRGLSSLCDHLNVQYCTVVHLGGEFPQGFSPCVLILLVLWGLGPLGTSALALSPLLHANPSLHSVLLFSPVLEFELTAPLKSEKSCPAVAVYSPWDESTQYPWSVTLGAAAQVSRVRKGVEITSAAQQLVM